MQTQEALTLHIYKQIMSVLCIFETVGGWTHLIVRMQADKKALTSRKQANCMKLEGRKGFAASDCHNHCRDSNPFGHLDVIAKQPSLKP